MRARSNGYSLEVALLDQLRTERSRFHCMSDLLVRESGLSLKEVAPPATYG